MSKTQKIGFGMVIAGLMILGIVFLGTCMLVLI